MTCVISWPRTPASSASVLIRPSAPRVMCTMPPGAAKALTPSVSRTMNSQFEIGPRAGLRQHGADEGDVLRHRLVLKDAELVRAPAG